VIGHSVTLQMALSVCYKIIQRATAIEVIICIIITTPYTGLRVVPQRSIDITLRIEHEKHAACEASQVITRLSRIHGVNRKVLKCHRKTVIKRRWWRHHQLWKPVPHSSWTTAWQAICWKTEIIATGKFRNQKTSQWLTITYKVLFRLASVD